jgi:ATP-dependent Clp protease ATP-binding subunit ClpA/ActR/RegA family two-component response regulator
LLSADLITAQARTEGKATSSLPAATDKSDAELTVLWGEVQTLIDGSGTEDEFRASREVADFIKKFEARCAGETSATADKVKADFAVAVIEEFARAESVKSASPNQDADTFVKSRVFPNFDNLPISILTNEDNIVDGLPTLDANIEELLIGLGTPGRRGIALIGPRGGGKSFLMEQLAGRIQAGRVPGVARDLAIIKVDIAGIVSKYVGDTSRKLKAIFDYAKRVESCVLYIDEFQGLVTSGGPHATEHLSVLKDLLTSSEYKSVQLVVATTSQEFDTYVRVDRALERRLSPFLIRSPQGEEEIQAVSMQAKRLYKNAALLSDDLVKRAVGLAREYLPTQPTIQSAIELLAGAHSRFEFSQQALPLAQALLAECERQTGGKLRGIPSLGQTESLLGLLQEGLVGQPHITKALVEAYQLSTIGLGKQSGPKCAFLFAGPPGTGKTHAARIYAEFLGCDFVHLHMGEYAVKDICTTKLIGVGPGWVGSEVGGTLLNAVRQSPSAVVLFDEIDQAHPSVIDLLYQALDEGYMRDGFGNPVSFRNATLFFTTNRGDFSRGRRVGFAAHEGAETSVGLLTREEVVAALKRHFSEAFLSRITHALVFGELSPAVLSWIAMNNIRAEALRLLETAALELEVEDIVGALIVAANGLETDARSVVKDILPNQFWRNVGKGIVRNWARMGQTGTLRICGLLPFAFPELEIVLLDDHPDETAKMIPERAGHVETPRCSVSEAAACVRKEHDLVLLDLHWGKGPDDGLAILRQIRAEHPDVPVIIYTILSDHELKLKFFETGATAFVAKDDAAHLARCLRDIRTTKLIRKLSEAGYEHISYDFEVLKTGGLTVTLTPVRRGP